MAIKIFTGTLFFSAIFCISFPLPSNFPPLAFSLNLSIPFAETLPPLTVQPASSLPLFKSANMSLGINLINSLLRKVTPLLYGNYDIEIIEKHHNQKLDSPSGTALLLADTIKESISEETHYVHGRDGHKKREKND